MQELTFEQVEVVSGGFQGLTGPEDLFGQFTGFYQIDSSSGTSGGPTNKCRTKAGAVSCLMEAAGIYDVISAIGNYVKDSMENGVKYPFPIPAAPENYEGGPHQRDPLL